MPTGQILFSEIYKVSETNKALKITAKSVLLTGATIRAKPGNAAVVHIGGSGVGATSYPLEAGESVNLDIVDLSRFYVYGKENDEVYIFGLQAV
jgi:hypothetical protein